MPSANEPSQNITLIDPQLTERVLQNIKLERARQDIKWGEQRHQSAMWMMILQEEIGEVAKAYLEQLEDAEPKEMIHELVQAGAVITAWIEMEVKRIEEQRGIRYIESYGMGGLDFHPDYINRSPILPYDKSSI